MQAQLLLESAQAMKSKAARDGAFATLAACALRYGQLEAVAGASIAALTRNEHLAGVLAELAEFCEAKYHDERLVRSHHSYTAPAGNATLMLARVYVTPCDSQPACRRRRLPVSQMCFHAQTPRDLLCLHGDAWTAEWHLMYRGRRCFRRLLR